MTVSKYGKGKFRANVYFGPLGELLPAPDKGKKRLTKVFDSQREAKAQEREWESMKDNLRDREAGLTIAEWHKTFLALPRRETTQNVYEYATNPFASTHGDIPMEDWSVKRARADAVGRPQSQVKYIKAMFARAVDDGIIDSSPYREIKTPRSDPQKVKAAFHEVWPQDPDEQIKQLDRILEAADEVGQHRGPELRAFLAFAAWTGARPGEVRGLHREDFDVANGFATIKRVIDRTGEEFQSTKTGGDREIFVPQPAIIEYTSTPVRLNQPYAFTNMGQPWKSATFNTYWQSIRQLAKCPKLRLYDMRHFCATQLLELGVSEDDVARQLGHTTADLVREVYGHPSQRRALERIRHTINTHSTGDSSQVRHIKFGGTA